MRSASTVERLRADDLTARATIREAALDLFARRGYAAASVREIAAAAGVSPALLFHHFGSKQGLRDAIDEWLAATVAEAVAGAVAEERPEGGAVLTERFRRFSDVGRVHPEVSDYVGRILSEGGAPARDLFDRMVETTRAELAGLERRGLVRPAEDEVARAMLLLFLELGPILLRPLVERQLGDSLFSERSVERWVAACATLLGEGVLIGSRGDHDSD